MNFRARKKSREHPSPDGCSRDSSFLLQLFEERPQLLGHGQADAGGVLDDGDALVRDIEADDRASQDAAAADDVGVERVRHADEQEDEDLLADAAKACLARELLLRDAAEHAGDVVDGDEDDEREDKRVLPADKTAKNRAEACRPGADVERVVHEISPFYWMLRTHFFESFR